MVSEHAFELLKKIPTFLNWEDCWRIVLSAIRFDDGTGKSFAALMEGGAANVLKPETSDSSSSADDVTSTSVTMPNNTYDRAAERQGQQANYLRKQSIMVVVNKTMENLHTVKYQGLSLSAWIVILKRSMMLQFVLRKGYSMSGVVDEDGNTILHVAAAHGSHGIMDLVGANSMVLLEWENNAGQTAAEMGAKVGSMKTLRKLFSYGADARRSLAGFYYGWILAVARQKEKNEMNLQTGRTGDDDTTYFPMDPDPTYMFWYDTYRKLDFSKSISRTTPTPGKSVRSRK
jgi:hypothetical protein